MSNYRRKSSAKSSKELDQVEELLRAAEDDMVLKLSVGSHTSSSSSSTPLDQDLVRRFEALKAPKRSTNLPPKSRKSNEKVSSGGDPFARFSALKGSSEVESQARSDGGGGSEDEVEKLMQWAVDAARLDPSLSEDEDSEDDEESDETDTEEEKDSGDDDKKKNKVGK